ncbi:hypothetical protein RZS08_08490, partial [Arthrospira platensis SPKY1]|nr:hypothetical protein [Arthrospira platensis SPKY1]
QTLEVTWNNGSLVLDSKNTNYSFGSLQRILRYGLHHIGFENVKTMNQILVLGVAGGSVIQTLRYEIEHKNLIIGVEIDEHIIKLANTYFNLDKIPNTQIIRYDAFEFILATKKLFDLVIVDLFEDTRMPAFQYENHFWFRLAQILSKNGKVLFNTMELTPEQTQKNQHLKHAISHLFEVDMLKKVEVHNQLIILTKK